MNALQIFKEIEINFQCDNNGFNTLDLADVLKISENNLFLELWYPRGYGKQKLYDLIISYNGKVNNFLIVKLIFLQFSILDVELKQSIKLIKKIAFRKINLIQDLVDFENPDKGRNFYFEVNNIAIFLKGKLIS